MRQLAFIGLLFGIISAACAGEKSRPGMPDANLSWLDNGVVQIGCDLDFGGAITWFSLSGGENIINNFDAGRQVQMAFYSGPHPFTTEDQKPTKHWQHLGWNPIQAGDDFGNGSRVIEHHNDGKSITLTCVPLQWPLNDVKAECRFSAGISLHGASAVLNYHFQNNRSDKTQYRARHQELPAIYSNTPFQRVISYTGGVPFTGEKVSQIPAKRDGKWQYWTATEGWAALVNQANWGLGVWSPTQKHFIGGAAGATGGEIDCGYLAPLATEIIDHNISYSYSCDLVLGTVDEIRAHAGRRSRNRKSLPEWEFSKSRQGWSLLNSTDGGWPLKGGIAIKEKCMLLSPTTFWPADRDLQVHVLLDRAISTSAKLFQRYLNEKSFDPVPAIFTPKGETLIFDLKNDQPAGSQLKLQIPDRCVIQSIRIVEK